jgi:hypothetical protein
MLRKNRKRKQKEFTEQYGDIYDLTYKAPPRKSDAERQTKERIKLAETEEAVSASCSGRSGC